MPNAIGGAAAEALLAAIIDPLARLDARMHVVGHEVNVHDKLVGTASTLIDRSKEIKAQAASPPPR